MFAQSTMLRVADARLSYAIRRVGRAGVRAAVAHVVPGPPRTSTRATAARASAAASGGAAAEEGDVFASEPSFARVPLDASGVASAAPFGPPAILLSGFMPAAVVAVRALMAEMGAEFVAILVTQPAMLSVSVLEALAVKQPAPESLLPVIVPGRPRMAILSGMTGAEVGEVVGAFRDAFASDDETVFAAAVPNNAMRVLGELLEEVLGDHTRLKAKAEGTYTEEGEGRINTSGLIGQGVPKVVTEISCTSLGTGKTSAFCRCWQSKTFPLCDGAHATHNAATGDNVGPLVLKS